MTHICITLYRYRRDRRSTRTVRGKGRFYDSLNATCAEYRPRKGRGETRWRRQYNVLRRRVTGGGGERVIRSRRRRRERARAFHSHEPPLNFYISRSPTRWSVLTRVSRTVEYNAGLTTTTTTTTSPVTVRRPRLHA